MLYKLCEQLDNSLSSCSGDYENLICSIFKEIDGCNIAEKNNLHVNPAAYVSKNKHPIDKKEFSKFEKEIIAKLKRGESVYYHGFGKFKLINVKVRTHRNPITSEKIYGYKRTIQFIPFKHLIEEINK
jgi:hypothetical protein